MLASLFAYNDIIFDKMEENFEKDFVPELEYKVDLKTLDSYDQASVVNSFEHILGQHNIHYEKEFSEDFFVNGERYTLFKNTLTQTTKKRVIDIKVGGEISDLFESKISFSFEKNNIINGKSLYESNVSVREPSFAALHEDVRQIWNDKAEKIVKEWNKNGKGMRRKKNRRSYLFSQFVKIDVTDVNTMSMDGKTSSSKELEVELIADIDKDTLEHFSDAIRFVGNLIETICLIKDYNNWTSFPETKRENYKEFIIGNSSQPRNFKKGDFVWGGLIPIKESGTIYSVTIKSDGLRKNLVIHPSGIWTVRPKRGGAPIADKLGPLVCKCKGGAGVHTQFCPVSYLGSIIDGELMDDVFIPFDILSYRRNSSVQGLPHLPMNPGDSARLLVAKTVCDSISKTYPSSPLKILYKKFFSLGKTRDKMVESLVKCEQYMNNFGRPNDGYILTPINYKYRSEGGSSLHEIPDTCKLKPWEKLSIDFYFNSVDKIPKVYDKGVLVPFLGIDGFSSDNYVIPPFLDITVEMEPVRERGERGEGVVMVFSRVREDKGANSMKVARDVWRDIQDPIFLADLRGETFRFNRLFQNGVKSHLIENIVKGSYVLDIGSGNGGDLGKYTKRGVSKLFAVDPNEDNMREFQRRLSNMKTKVTVKTLLAGGEESEIISESSYNFFNNVESNLFKNGDHAPESSPPSPPLYITMMLSLSFFWKSREMLSGLADTIKKVTERHNGTVYFLFYTIEGGRTLEFFDKYGTNDVKVGPVDLKLKLDERILLLDYPNSIVGRQTEYLVNLDELAELLGVTFNIVDTSPEAMEDGEYILSPNEINYSSMYVAGFAKLK